MDILFFCVVVFLFLLAVFDLSVGVSNDAVNFLNSAIGSKAASFRTIIAVAVAGVFLGAVMSNGMMDIARHGIFRPEHFSFYELMCVFMAVMVCDILLLDMFNTLGMPTSTTVSMVFELLGASFVLALVKIASGGGMELSALLNTGKALSVILGIFLSVAIAFVFGTVVQFLTRMLFSFNYLRNLKWKAGLFGGVCATAIVYFLIVKGAKDLTFMTPAVKAWISANTAVLMGGCLVFFSLLMQLLYLLRVNVLKVVVMMGTFSLAMAFAGNDLVNFIGVPLSGLSAWQDYAANGGGQARSFLMDSLNGPANTPVVFLIGAGVVMVLSLATSKKARNVSKTEIGLASRQTGEEMFASSPIARRLVRWSLSALAWVNRNTPHRLRVWFAKRFNVSETIVEQGAAFDLVRASVNLVLAGVLITVGTSLKLPLSTTFVTFMVAMGTSLADRAWVRESAVFRITGVISVIGGWFLTAGAAFIGAGLIVTLMYFGGQWAMLALALLTVLVLVHSNRRFRKSRKEDMGQTLFQTILSTENRKEAWNLLLLYIGQQQQAFLNYARKTYMDGTQAFIDDSVGVLIKEEKSLLRYKNTLKTARRKETLCLRHVGHEIALEKNTWFHLSNNCCINILYDLLRINEVSKEHVGNNFLPLPPHYTGQFDRLRTDVDGLFAQTLDMMQNGLIEKVPALRRQCDEVKDKISDTYHQLYDRLQEGNTETMGVTYVYLNILYETHEMVSSLRKWHRAYAKLIDSDFSGRSSM